MPAYPLTQLNLELIVSNSLDLGKELTLDLIVSWQVPICSVFYMLWGWAPFKKQWNQELFVFYSFYIFQHMLISFWSEPNLVDGKPNQLTKM